MSTSDQDQKQDRTRERETDRRPEGIAGPGDTAGPDGTTGPGGTTGRTGRPAPRQAVEQDEAPEPVRPAVSPITPVAPVADDADGTTGAAVTAPEASEVPAVSEAPERQRLTPRQARRLRIALSSVGMAAMAVVLALRIASRSSVLVVGVYGLALILCGVVIELSRNGRTRLGSWLLGIGLVAAVCADQLLIP
ncbi:hypothetical protein OG596_03105 [Streptomyces sp. NBC_01102]|uniref:hypothetical protein n=1 Tax=Streptomyces sp. NBC_01102 TaxID=2903749 RepID=UPI00386F32DB|nr:hypothetical protein OG596_03105 [Streptomyces sp. NBC_01102]